MLKGFSRFLENAASVSIGDVSDGAEALALVEAAKFKHSQGIDTSALVIYVARDQQRASSIENALTFFAPEIEALPFPSWDCQPYDRASPNAAVVARRVATLALLARSRGGERPRVVITTVNAFLQKTAPLAWIKSQSLVAQPGNAIDMAQIVAFLENNGYLRSGTVNETGEYAVRGGILDLFVPGLPSPIRLDFFGDTLETIKYFDPETQRSTTKLKNLELMPMGEFQLITETIKRFRQSYVASFGAPSRDDVLYETISEGRRFPGMEHWMPLFHDKMDTLLSFAPDATLMLDNQADEVATQRIALIHDYYDARKTALESTTKGSLGSGVPYKPLEPSMLYATQAEWNAITSQNCVRLTPFALQQTDKFEIPLSLETKIGHNFASVRADANQNVFDAAIKHIKAEQAQGKRVLIASWSEGARDRLFGVFKDHGLKDTKSVASLSDARKLSRFDVCFGILPLEAGFTTPDLTIIGEQDILGERLSRQRKAPKRAADFIVESGSLSAKDLVVHVAHGIARFIGLKAITVSGAPHDCLELHYAGGDKLFLPVENIELLSRYGSEDAEAALDKLGGAGWQNRKAKLKKRIRDMARQLIKIAAARLLQKAPRFEVPDSIYDEFVARFPYDETQDQQSAIDSILTDMNSGRPMDRLVCGDVGFGKTEVALRAAFVAAMSGKQVAVVVPTTLLARQHFRTFAERFKGLPLNLAQASRMVTAADLKKTKEGLEAGQVDIVVGTHALLGKTISFKDLGLLIIDEEQHFGVGHKERLKELRSDVHVLTLSATPIPRTLQLALTGVRELSLITTPPVDRLAVRSFVTPFDPLVIREALLRERYRGGQSFYVCPRVDDIKEVKAFLDANVPEIKVGIGHGQMPASELEDIMSQFYDGRFDVLLSTTIVESGLDIPRANTLIVHRADMFGLSQLYQLRGRVGRAKTRAYALFTLPVKKPITATAERRLKVLQSLDSLGAGFQLASHDLDIRGSGNLLGDEQSGHIKEVGFELYQQMLKEAVEALKNGVETEVEEQWSPTIAIGTSVLIPESYIADLDLRMNLYRRLSHLENDNEIGSFAAEMVDRFGPLPEECDQLFKIVAIKILCRRANIEKVEAGPKGIVVSFRDNAFANPTGLVKYVQNKGSAAKVRPDMKIVFQGDFSKTAVRLESTRRMLFELVRVAEKGR
jgi:transcription-repair coupling factor (superfamily II helicase)